MLSTSERAKLYAAAFDILRLPDEPTTPDESRRAGWAACISLYTPDEAAQLQRMAAALREIIADQVDAEHSAIVAEDELRRVIGCSVRASTVAMLAGLVPRQAPLRKVWIEDPGDHSTATKEVGIDRWDGRRFHYEW